MKRFGLIGFPLGNNFSVNYFTGKFNALKLRDHVYENYPLENIEGLITLIEKNPDLEGLNVTVPHKISILKYLDELDESAGEVGAVNCVKIVYHQHSTAYSPKFEESKGSSTSDSEHQTLNKKYKLIGFNTDVFGFEQSLTGFIDKKDTSLKALILGTGGASKAIAFVLTRLGIEFAFVTRNIKPETSNLPREAIAQKWQAGLKRFNYKSLNETIFERYHLIINCTPVGMFPEENQAPPLPYQFITSEHFGFDLIYHPEETMFLKYFREVGAKTKNGLEMLHLQAEKAWEIFQKN